MSKKQAIAEIEKAMKNLKIKSKAIYTAQELNDIAKYVGIDMFYVMYYLRYGTL